MLSEKWPGSESRSPLLSVPSIKNPNLSVQKGNTAVRNYKEIRDIRKKAGDDV